MRTTRVTSSLRCHCFELTLEGRAGSRGLAEQVDGPTTRTQSALVTTATGRTGSCAAANQACRVMSGESAVPRQPGRQGFQLLQRQRLGRGPVHWRRLSPAAARGSGRGHLGRCGNTSGRCLLAAGACWRKGSRGLGFALVRLEAQGVVLLMHSKKNHRLTDCS